MAPTRPTWVPPQSSTGKRLARPLAVALDPHRHDAHLVAVFFAKQRARARLHRLVDRHQPRHDRLVLQHHAVGDVLDRHQLRLADGLGMGEIEAQPLFGDERALLRDMVAQHLTQRLVQQMGGGMVGLDRVAARAVDGELHALARRDLAHLHPRLVHEKIAEPLLGRENLAGPPLRGDRPDIPDLTARFRVERRLVDEDQTGLAGLQREAVRPHRARWRRRRPRPRASRSRETPSPPACRVSRTRAFRSRLPPSPTTPCAPRRAGAPWRR